VFRFGHRNLIGETEGDGIPQAPFYGCLSVAASFRIKSQLARRFSTPMQALAEIDHDGGLCRIAAIA
jgi:hypothetical protein